MTPVDAARLVAEHSADLGTSLMRCADAILRDPDEFTRRYGRAARAAPRTVFPDLLDAHAVLVVYHAARKEPAGG